MAEEKSIKILVVDDTPEDLATYRRYLSKIKQRSFCITEASTGTAALALCGQDTFDCILLDYHLPDFDGLDLLRKLSADPVGPITPIVMLTASGDVRTIVEAMKLGAQDYLFKGSTTPEQLCMAIDNAIEKVALRAQVDQQREWLRTSLSSIGDGVIACDLNECVNFMNQIAEDLTGWPQAEAMGKPLVEVFNIVNEHTRKLVDNPLTRVLRDGRIVGLANHTILIARDGTERPIDDSGAPIRDSRKVMLGAILVFRDITERKRAEAEAEALLKSERAARAQAEEASRLKDIFLSTMSHELRTPLTPILGWAKILQTKELDRASQRKGLEVIERSARTQKALIDDLLDVSRIITGKLFLDRKPVNLHRILETAIETVQSTADAKGVTIRLELPQENNVVLGDANRLQQIFWNLLANAIKFTPRGGEIGASVVREASQLKVSVKDNGQGIPLEFLPFVFDRFRQADGESTRKQGGLGLGLAIVRHLTELHGGTVCAVSEGANRGAEFTIRLPIAAYSPGAAQMERAMNRDPLSESLLPEEVAPWSALTLPGNKRVLEGISLVLLDDENDARDLLQTVLVATGARVAPARSAAEALKLLSSQKFDIFISDIGMPDENGYSLIAKVRALPDPDMAGIPSIALTAYAGSEERRRALKAGFQLHIPKPVEFDVLIDAIIGLVHS